MISYHTQLSELVVVAIFRHNMQNKVNFEVLYKRACARSPVKSYSLMTKSLAIKHRDLVIVILGTTILTSSGNLLETHDLP